MATIQTFAGFRWGDHGGLAAGNNTFRLFNSVTGTLGTDIQIIAAAAFGTCPYGLRISGTNNWVRWDTNNIGSSKNVIVGAGWFRVSTDPSGLKETHVFDLSSAGTDWASFDYDPSTNRLRAFINATNQSSTNTYVVNDELFLEFRYDISANPHVLDWRIDGVAQTQVTLAQAADTFTGFVFGDRSSGVSGAFDYGDWVISTTAADYPLGEHHTAILKVDPAGTVTLSGTSGNFRTFAGTTPTLTAWDATTARDAVDELPPNTGSAQDGFAQITTATSDYVELPMETYTLSGSEAIVGAKLIAAGWQASNASGTLGFRSYNGTTETTLVSGSTAFTDLGNNTANHGWITKMLTLADVNTQSELDALAIRVGFSSDATPDMGVQAVYVEILLNGEVGTGTDYDIDGDRSITSTQTAALALSRSVDGTSTVTATRTAAMSVAEVMSGDRSITATELAAMALSRAVSGDRDVTVTLAAAIDVTKQIDGNTETTVTLTAAMDQNLALSATETVTATRTAALNVDLTSSGSLTVTETATAALALSRQADATATVTAALTAAMDQTKVIAATLTETVDLVANMIVSTNHTATATRSIAVTLSASMDVVRPFPYSPQAITAEFLINGEWEDFTNLRPTYECYMLGQNGMDAVTVALERRADQDAHVNTLVVSFQFFDPDAILDIDNAASPYYRLLAFGTPVRVAIEGEVIAYGGISAITPDWSDNDNVIIVTVELKGQIGILETSSNPQKSALARHMPNVYSPVGYWPMEEGKSATLVSSGLLNGQAMTINGTVNFHTAEGPSGSGQLADKLTTDTGFLQVPDVVTSNDFTIGIVYKSTVPASGILASWENPTVSATYRLFLLSVNNSEFSNAEFISIDAIKPDGTIATLAGAFIEDVQPIYKCLVYQQQQNGANIEWFLYVNGVLLAEFEPGDPFVDNSGPPRNVLLTPLFPAYKVPTEQAISLGHFIMWDGVVDAAYVMWRAMLGFPGETARERLERLSIEEKVDFQLDKDATVADDFNRTYVDGLGFYALVYNYTWFGTSLDFLDSDFQVTPSQASTYLANTVAFRGGFLDHDALTLTNAMAEIETTCVAPEGGVLEPGGLLFRGFGLDNYIMCRCVLRIDGTASLEILTDGDDTLLAGLVEVSGFTHDPLIPIRVKGAVIDDQIMMKIWKSTEFEPPFWQLTATDPSPRDGWVGWRNGRGSGNTNSPNPTIYVTDWTVYNLDPPTELMGPQQIGTPVELMVHAARADGGILSDRTDSLGLRYRPRVSLYSQAPSIELNYGSAHLSPTFRPEYMDSALTNDVTVRRTEGASGRYIIEDSDPFHWTTEAPPYGANQRQREIEVNLDLDSAARLHASWHAHLNSWREKVLGNITLELQRPELVEDPGLSANIRATRLGNVITIDTEDGPRWLPPDEMRVMIDGWTRTVAQFADKWEIKTRPADRYEVEFVDTSGSEVATAISTSATTFKMAVTLGPEWSTTDPPYYWQINGEVMRVDAISANTPSFIAAGTVAHANNASVSPGLPAGMTVDIGQSMFMWAAIRNSGTGTVNAVSGWEKLVDFGNVCLFHRYYITGDSAPTVTFSGGVANADTSARIFAFAGLSKEFVSGTKLVPAAHTQLNSSAANIAYPALPVNRSGAALLFAWKQDDDTGIAPPSGFTEMGDDTTTTGDDQSIYAAYDLTAAAAVAGTLTVTGGAAAISRAVIAAFRPLYSPTVTRSINGVVASHAVGDAINGWRMGVTGL